MIPISTFQTLSLVLRFFFFFVFLCNLTLLFCKVSCFLCSFFCYPSRPWVFFFFFFFFLFSVQSDSSFLQSFFNNELASDLYPKVLVCSRFKIIIQKQIKQSQIKSNLNFFASYPLTSKFTP